MLARTSKSRLEKASISQSLSPAVSSQKPIMGSKYGPFQNPDRLRLFHFASARRVLRYRDMTSSN